VRAWLLGLGTLLAQACLTPERAREAAPSSTPEASPSKPEPPASPAVDGAREEATSPEQRALPPPAAPAEAARDNADTHPARKGGRPSHRARAAPPAKPKKATEAELEIGGSAGAAPGNGTLELSQELSQRLSNAVSLASPDCASARQRKRTICDLAEQICGLSERDPNVASVAEYCEIAQRRCNEAGQRTRQRCDD
jgi:hypothetical protein